MSSQFADELLAKGVISKDQLQAAMRQHEQTEKDIDEILVNMGIISEFQVAEYLSGEFGVPPIDIESTDLQDNLVNMIPKYLAVENVVIPISLKGSTLLVAMVDPDNILVIDDLRFATGYNIDVCVASERVLKQTLEKCYGEKPAPTAGAPLDETTGESGSEDSIQQSVGMSNEPTLTPPPFDLTSEPSKQVEPPDVADLGSEVDDLVEAETETGAKAHETLEDDVPMLVEEDSTAEQSEIETLSDLDAPEGEGETAEVEAIEAVESLDDSVDDLVEEAASVNPFESSQIDQIDQEDQEDIVESIDADSSETTAFPEAVVESEELIDTFEEQVVEASGQEEVVEEVLEMTEEAVDEETDSGDTTPIDFLSSIPSPEIEIDSKEDDETQVLDFFSSQRELEEKKTDNVDQNNVEINIVEDEILEAPPEFDAESIEAEPITEEIAEEVVEPIVEEVVEETADSYDFAEAAKVSLDEEMSVDTDASAEPEGVPEFDVTPDEEEASLIEEVSGLTEQSEAQESDVSSAIPEIPDESPSVDAKAQAKVPEIPDDTPEPPKNVPIEQFIDEHPESGLADEAAVEQMSAEPGIEEPPEQVAEKPKIVVIRKDRKAAEEAEPKCIVLAVDDSPTVQKIVSVTLQRQGYEVNVAGNAMQALAKIDEQVPDIIFLDINLPHMDGYQLCKLIKGNDMTKSVPIVMLSGKDGFFDKVRGKMAGAADYITKPFQPISLIEAVEKYVSKST